MNAFVVLRRESEDLSDRATVLAAVEDDATFDWIELLCRIERIGVLRAVTSAAVTPLARVGRPDLILAEYRLADGASPPLLRALREDEACAKARIAGLCDPDDVEARRELRAAGCERILSKPLRAGEFLDFLREGLAASDPARPAAPRGRGRTRPRPR